MRWRARRIGFYVIVGLAMFTVAEHRISDGTRDSRSPIPPLWQPAPDSNSPGHGHTAASAGSLVTPALAASSTLSCPLVLSLNRTSPFTLTSPEEGVLFDVDGDGHPDRTSWPTRGTDVAFLALDRNGDGEITTGAELISERSDRSRRHGFTALIGLAKNAAGGDERGGLDDSHPLFARLLLWTDANQNGRSEPQELEAANGPLAQIALGYQRHYRRDRHGNESRYRGFAYVRTEPAIDPLDGAEIDRLRPIYDVCLVTR